MANGHGGARSGSGRKPRVVRAFAAVEGGKPASDVSLIPPADMEAAAKPFWAELAPHAIAAGTLTERTVPAFSRLCAALAKHERWEAQIAKDGDTYFKTVVDGAGQEHTEVKAHPLISRSQALENAIRGWFKDFAINPFGKPLAAGRPKASAANPWEALRK